MTGAFTHRRRSDRSKTGSDSQLERQMHTFKEIPHIPVFYLLFLFFLNVRANDHRLPQGRSATFYCPRPIPHDPPRLLLSLFSISPFPLYFSSLSLTLSHPLFLFSLSSLFPYISLTLSLSFLSPSLFPLSLFSFFTPFPLSPPSPPPPSLLHR